MKFKKIIAGVMGAVMAASCVPMSVNSSLITSISASAETSGTCGDNVNWVLSDDGVLTISGTGDMSNYNDFEIIAIPQITANIHNSETTHYNPKYKLFPEHF